MKSSTLGIYVPFQKYAGEVIPTMEIEAGLME